MAPLGCVRKEKETKKGPFGGLQGLNFPMSVNPTVGNPQGEENFWQKLLHCAGIVRRE